MGKTLSIQNVNKSFTVDGQKVDVLKDINLEIQEVSLSPSLDTVAAEKVLC